MSKPRIAAWIAGSALLLSSGVALAQEAQPEDPTVEETELVESTVVDENLEMEEDADLEKSDEQVVEAAGVEDLDEVEENHGSVVSQAAKNHEFDEACGNHGAYVSEVARGGDPDDPECAKEDVVEGEVEAETAETAETPTEKPGKSGDAKGKAKASGGKAAKRGK